MTTAIAALAVGVGLLVPTSTASAQEPPPPGILPEGNWTEAQATWLVNAVRTAERELPAFADTARLQQLGFIDIGVVAPGGYEHWVNVGWFNDDHILNPLYPESLVFHRTAGGGRQVVAAMYFVRPEWTLETLPSMISWIPGFHDHPELCSDDSGRVVGFAGPDGTCTRGRPVLTPMTHVWIVDNECGHRFGGIDAGGLHCDYHDH
jgi:hypothetical protein